MKFRVSRHAQLRIARRDPFLAAIYDPIRLAQRAWEEGTEPPPGFDPEAGCKPPATEHSTTERYEYRLFRGCIFVFAVHPGEVHLLTIYKDIYGERGE